MGDGMYVQLPQTTAMHAVMTLLHHRARPILVLGNAAAGE
jgi:hypothetical protein